MRRYLIGSRNFSLFLPLQCYNNKIGRLTPCEPSYRGQYSNSDPSNNSIQVSNTHFLMILSASLGGQGKFISCAMSQSDYGYEQHHRIALRLFCSPKGSLTCTETFTCSARSLMSLTNYGDDILCSKKSFQDISDSNKRALKHLSMPVSNWR